MVLSFPSIFQCFVRYVWAIVRLDWFWCCERCSLQHEPLRNIVKFFGYARAVVDFFVFMVSKVVVVWFACRILYMWVVSDLSMSGQCQNILMTVSLYLTFLRMASGNRDGFSGGKCRSVRYQTLCLRGTCQWIVWALVYRFWYHSQWWFCFSLQKGDPRALPNSVFPNQNGSLNIQPLQDDLVSNFIVFYLWIDRKMVQKVLKWKIFGLIFY